MKGHLTRRIASSALLGCALLGIAGTAVAMWTAGGTGTGYADTDTAEEVTITPGTTTGQLYPGGTADVKLSISNPNAFAVTVPSLSLDTGQGSGGFAVDGGHSGCTPLSILGFATQTNGGAGWTLAAGTTPVTLTGALSMNASAANACQGATFTVYVQAP
jgi:hypothetical protein